MEKQIKLIKLMINQREEINPTESYQSEGAYL